VESTRNNVKFTAPLTAISAAVVGVIMNLAVFFAWHTFWPKGTAATPFAAPFEWFPVLVAIAAFVALWKYKLDIMKVIGASALLGLGYTLLREVM
jgi:chromate transporter